MERSAFRPVQTRLRTRLVLGAAGLFLSTTLILPGEPWTLGALTPTAGAAEAAAAGSTTQQGGSKGTTSKKRSKSTGSRTQAASSKSKSTGAKAGASASKSRSKKSYSKKSYGSKRYGKTRRRGSIRMTYTPSRGVRARAAVVVDAQTGQILYDKNSTTPMPIASLTKMMTAMVFLESDPDLSRRVMVSREDLAGSGRSQLRAGEVLTMRDLLHSALLSSDNAATRALVRNSGVEPEEYLARMNRKAQVMGLSHTHFVEFTGLSEQNVSTAQEYAQLLKTATGYPMIGHITTLPDYTYRTTVREHHLVNTNRLARYGVFDTKGGKTGYISESGYCLATWVSTSTREVISVVLGAPSNSARFSETQKLIDRVVVAPAAGGGAPANATSMAAHGS